MLEVLPEVATRVSEDEPIAILRDAFGDVIREYAAPYDGVVIGKSNNPVGPTGSRILHLGIELSDEEDGATWAAGFFSSSTVSMTFATG